MEQPAAVMQQVQAPISQSVSSSGAVGDKLSYYISARFKDDSNKFSGLRGECWNEYLSDYLYAAKEYTQGPQKVPSDIKLAVRRHYISVPLGATFSV